MDGQIIKKARYKNYQEVNCILHVQHQEYYAGMNGRQLLFTKKIKEAVVMQQWEADMKMINWPSVNFTKWLLK